jgi:myosin-1
MPGGFNLKISDSIEYAKKPGKMQIIKVLKDSTMRDDFYKSGAIHTSQGESPNSVSRPMPKGKPVAAKPFTKGRLIQPGGPGGRPSRITNGTTRNTKPVAQSYGSASQGRNLTPQHGAAAAAAAISIPSHTRNTPSSSSGRAVPPPPPPAPPAAAKDPQYRALYDFAGQSANELTLRKDELVTIVQKENNGKPVFALFTGSNTKHTFQVGGSPRILQPKVGFPRLI